jgi:large subunit ribosomal protein L27e
VVVILSGRYAGKKAVVLRTYEDGTKERRFGHALVAGVERAPKRITRAMEKELDEGQRAKRMSVRPFVKFVNFQHIMPTRYNLDVSEALEKAIGDTNLVDKEGKKTVKLEIKKKLEDRYKTLGQGKNEKASTGAAYFFKCVFCRGDGEQASALRARAHATQRESERWPPPRPRRLTLPSTSHPPPLARRKLNF